MLKVDLARLQKDGPLWIEGTVEAEDLLDEEFNARFNGAPEVKLQASFAGSGEVVVRGRVRGEIIRGCRRCLKETDRELNEEVTMVFAPSDDLTEDDGAMREIDAHQVEIDLVPPLREEFILSIPPYAECRPDCKGLCPKCGADLNDEVCDCGGPEPDARWDALRALQEE